MQDIVVILAIIALCELIRTIAYVVRETPDVDEIDGETIEHTGDFRSRKRSKKPRSPLDNARNWLGGGE